MNGLELEFGGQGQDHCHHPSHSCEHDISRRPFENFLRFGTNVHFTSRMIRIWWTKVKVTVTLSVSFF
ncbi:hypothetical protein P3514_30850, partial [Vibrio parahaemolyticus]|nr:hypothetical protein [Vibrio parahaemolyticus]